MVAIPADYHELFEKRTFAHLTTLDADGSPQTTPVWIDREGDHLLVNTARGRRKERNVARDPTVSVSMTDPDDPYRFLSVTGRVVDDREAGAEAHIDALARRYMDVEEYPNKDDESGPRVILEIEPDEVLTG